MRHSISENYCSVNFIGIFSFDISKSMRFKILLLHISINIFTFIIIFFIVSITILIQPVHDIISCRSPRSLEKFVSSTVHLSENHCPDSQFLKFILLPVYSPALKVPNNGRLETFEFWIFYMTKKMRNFEEKICIEKFFLLLCTVY